MSIQPPVSIQSRPSAGKMPDQPPPAPLKEAAVATGRVLRLAWSADRHGTLRLLAVHAATATADIVKLRAGREVLDAVLVGRPGRVQIGRLIVLGGASLVSMAGGSVIFQLQTPVAQAAGRKAEGLVLDTVTGLELADVEDPQFQDRIHRVLSASTQQGQLAGNAFTAARAVVGAVGALATMGAGDRALVPLGLLGAVPQVLSSQRNDPFRGSSWARQSRERWQLRSALTSTYGAHELRLFGVAPLLRGRYDALADREELDMVGTVASDARRSLLRAAVARGVAAPTTGRSLLKVSGRRLSLADAAGTGLASRQLNHGVGSLLQAIATGRRVASSSGEYAAFIRPVQRPALAGPAPSRDFGEIVLDDVSFAYRGSTKLVLDGVSLRIGRGEVVALVGENGSGKTTLAKLLCCLYRPARGTISWDDVDLAGCEPAAVRRHVSAVFQDFVRYSSLTAAENIGMGRPDRMDDRAAVERAATDAGAHTTIAALPQGYDTVLSRDYGGVNLSTGQWQRVALARAFLRDAPFVVLDEPTAALDPRAERALFESVASLYRDRSALLISHRLSSVRFADRVCVLAGGRITESGTHHELMDAGGTYAELFDLQARAYR